ncbi:hypothetical protein A3715_04960 [Oleiphilus sp. HI0009]|nr:MULTISPECIES: c-type cytochrome biogenesis protein CcmI [unclassified Oleiphilus]KZX83453.1 hypothetical protein A3715_04960 [Oleiphilus sp. HI0009]KZY65039.1 hypothetical protein A3738_09255 [Oleiphilus sp. HI0066]KZY71426.1 hypothetical protein A3739_04975 [Oleiphilus sp. HI0067]
MTQFWIIASILSLVAVWIVLHPWFKRHKLEEIAVDTAAEARVRANVRAYKERLRELNAELRSDAIDQVQFEEIKKELEATLLGDAKNVQARTDNLDRATSTTFISLIVVALALVGLSAYLYNSWGAYDLALHSEDSKFSAAEIAAAQSKAEAGDTLGLLVQLRDKLRENPANAEGWELLARSALNTNHFEIAAEAYGQLAEIESSPEIKAALYGLQAQTLYFSGIAIDAPPVADAVNKATLLNPQDTNIYGLKALASYDQGQFDQAIEYWKTILTLEPNHPSRGAIEEGISAAERALGVPSTIQVPASTVRVSVDVTIEPALLSQFNENEIVVVYARASVGPPMPLAVARFSPKQEINDIVLDDSLAMMPELKLSLFESVDVVVRITKGSVERKLGDYEKIISGVLVADQPRLSINIGAEDIVTDSK